MIIIKAMTCNKDKGHVMCELETKGSGISIRNELVAILLGLYDTTSPELVVDAIGQFTKELSNRQKGDV